MNRFKVPLQDAQMIKYVKQISEEGKCADVRYDFQNRQWILCVRDLKDRNNHFHITI